ncbi:hypothetical protein RHOFW510R12_00180 [Rhodanobacter sp. FW510-R12]|nr:hypothetical protein RHOFW104R8_04065 [Rhodanobacter sp. FW104-R8]KZC28322.1 hypothetical protein RhoFW510T8_11735 [Rhodanobacter sp. FW510-T8]KZC32697.1 hypothetical protein RhoFW510R10_11255 [Rhodanobacter sp. FW510-R10]
MMPSVDTESSDGYGFGNRSINLRGKGSFHLTSNVEGIPIAGIVGGSDLVDLENVASYELYRSAMPANVGFGVSNTTGALNMNLRRPEQAPSLELSQGFGTNAFSRTFIRADSGVLVATGTSMFVSTSYVNADKWRGGGKSPDGQRNLTIGVAQPIGTDGRLELFAMKSHSAGNSYRSMTFAQTQNKSNWRNYDYDNQLDPANPQFYCGFNRQQSDDVAIIGNLVLPIGEHGKFTFRPYWWDDEGYSLSASGRNVRRWDKVHSQRGFLTQYELQLTPNLDFTAGYWWMNMESPPPPVYQKDYTPTAGGDLVWNKWALLSKQGTHKFRSPFLQLTGNFGQNTLSGGLRLAEQEQPFLSYYQITPALPDVTYGQIWSYNPKLDPWQQVSSKNFYRWLPNLSWRHDFNASLALTAAYGRRMGRADWGPAASTYSSNRQAFVDKGVSLQRVFSNLKPEISDNLDLGLRYDTDRLTLAPNVYYARSRDKEVSLYDPIIGVAYYQSFARAIAKGIELEGSYQLNKALAATFAASWNRFAFDGNIRTTSGAAIATDGKQVPDAAQVLGKLGLNWRYRSWNVAPIMRYVGKRYGDILNKERVDGYFLADLHAGYEWSNAGALRDASVTLSVLNLFDKNYIGLVSSSDLNLNASTSYYAGAPRTVALTFNVKL